MQGESNAAGVRVLIQYHDEAKELVKNMAHFVSAGFHTNIALSYTMVIMILMILAVFEVRSHDALTTSKVKRCKQFSELLTLSSIVNSDETNDDYFA